MIRSFLIAALLALCAAGASAQISVKPTNEEPYRPVTVDFSNGHAVNTVSGVINSCVSMTVFWEQASTAVVSLYGVSQVDETFSQVRAGTLLAQFSSTAKVSISPQQSHLRFVVDTAETANYPSRARVVCSDIAGGGGGVAVVSIADYGPAANGVTDDSAAFNQASAVLADAGGGILYIPAGDYCLGENGASRVYSGLRITSDNTYVVGDGQGRTILRPCGDNGNYAVAFCDGATASACGSGSDPISNVGISDLSIIDADTFGDSGHSNYASMEQSNLAGGTPARGDDVEWNAGADDGTVAFYDAASGRIGIVEDTPSIGSLAASDVVSLVGGGWSATATSVEQRTTEETHGIIFRNAINAYASNVTLDSLSDEGIDCLYCQDAVLTNIRALDCGREEAGGACIAVGAGSSSVAITGSYLEGGTDSLVRSGAVITLATNTATPIDGVSISDSTLFDTGTGVDLIEAGVAINPNSAAITSVRITNTEIDLDADGLNAFETSGANLVEAAIVNSRIYGRINCIASDTCVATNVIASSANDDGTPFAGLDSIIGGSWSATNGSALYAVELSTGAIIQGAAIEGHNTCLRLTGNGASVTGNNFVSCGDGSGLDFVIRETSGNDNLVWGNYITAFDSGSASAAMRVGTTANAVSDGNGTGADTIADATTNRGDLTP